MKKRCLIALIITLQILYNNQATAAVKSEIVLKGFQNYTAESKTALTLAKNKYDSNVAAINLIYSNSLSKIKSNYETEIATAKALYEPKIDASKQAIKDAQNKLLTVNQVRVLKLGTSRNYWGNLDCPLTRPQCVSPDDKGNLFQIGDVTRLKLIMGERAEYLAEIQLMIDLGLIEMLNPVEYQKASATIRFEPDQIKTLMGQLDTAIGSANAKQKNAEEVARATTYAPLMRLSDEYETARNLYENQIIAGNLAIRAAKRASKNPSTYDKAFVAAYKFDYNFKGLDNIANLSFASLNSLRSLLSQYAIIELADKAAAVDSSYSYLAAEKINKAVGNVFTQDTEFQVPAKLVSDQYRKMTKVNLKF